MTGLREDFDRRGPWITRFWLDGEAFGGSKYDPSQDGRFALFENIAGPLSGKRILELGPLEGGLTLRLAREGAAVVAIEGRQDNYERCRYIKETFGLGTVEFLLGDVRRADLISLGPFDIVFNVGVLYHLDEPWSLLESLRAVSSRMFVWTHCVPENKARVRIDLMGRRLKGRWWKEGPLRDRLSGLQKRSFWPTVESLGEMLVLTGWRQVHWIDYSTKSTNGPSACLWVEG